jgi:hypothetical protein
MIDSIDAFYEGGRKACLPSGCALPPIARDSGDRYKVIQGVDGRRGVALYRSGLVEIGRRARAEDFVVRVEGR